MRNGKTNSHSRWLFFFIRLKFNFDLRNIENFLVAPVKSRYFVKQIYRKVIEPYKPLS
jgi:hypothetical protein